MNFKSSLQFYFSLHPILFFFFIDTFSQSDFQQVMNLARKICEASIVSRRPECHDLDD